MAHVFQQYEMQDRAEDGSHVAVDPPYVGFLKTHQAKTD